jgi:hypothetical protein
MHPASRPTCSAWLHRCDHGLACGHGASGRSCLRWQVVLTVQLVFQVKIAPFIDDRLDVVSCMCAASVDGPAAPVNSAATRWKRY